MKIVRESNFDKILSTLQEGKVIISPTDTVYGLLADAENKKTVERVFEIKRRDFKKPVPIFVQNLKKAKEIIFVNREQQVILEKFWPGKLTAVMEATSEAKKIFPFGIISEKGKIGVRIPDYELINNLLRKLKKSLIATSANISGKPSSTQIKKVISQFEDREIKPDLIINSGKLKESESSTVIDLTGSKFNILREGAIKKKELI